MADPLQALSDASRSKAEKKSFPDWMKPMLATLEHEPSEREGWIYERKLDGERVLSYIDPSGSARLMSRNRKDITDTYPDIASALESAAPAGTILDGEVVVFNNEGVSDFQMLQPLMQGDGSDRDADAPDPFYYVFDCLYISEHDITPCAQAERKKVLKKSLDWNGQIRFTPHRSSDGMRYYEEACEKGWEGLIAKDASAPYAHSRSRKWLKYKCGHAQELVIGGFTEPEGERVGFGALLLGYYRDDQFVFAGRVGTGFDDDLLRDLRQKLDSLERKTSPFEEVQPDKDGIHFVTPKLVCEVGFTTWTEDGKLRHPRFKGLRRDKSAEDVHRE